MGGGGLTANGSEDTEGHTMGIAALKVVEVGVGGGFEAVFCAGVEDTGTPVSCAAWRGPGGTYVSRPEYEPWRVDGWNGG